MSGAEVKTSDPCLFAREQGRGEAAVRKENKIRTWRALRSLLHSSKTGCRSCLAVWLPCGVCLAAVGGVDAWGLSWDEKTRTDMTDDRRRMVESRG